MASGADDTEAQQPCSVPWPGRSGARHSEDTCAAPAQQPPRGHGSVLLGTAPLKEPGGPFAWSFGIWAVQ